MSTALQRRPSLLSFEDFLEREKRSEIRHEYVDGHVYAMCGGTAVHNRMALNLAVALRSRLSQAGCEAFAADILVRVRKKAKDRGYYPDLVAACGVNDDAGVIEAPLYHRRNPFADHPAFGRRREEGGVHELRL